MMNGEERRPQTFSWARRWGAGLNLIITVAAVVALVMMVNYLAIRHYTRFHWSRDTAGALSKHTRNVLASLTNSVKVIAYYDTQDPLFPRVQAMLKEYEYASPRIQVQVVDYIRDGGTARLIKDRYRLASAADKNLVLFDMNGRTRTAYESELSDYDTSKVLQGITNEFERSHFKGELLFTSKIFAVANERSPTAYFLIGHGEHPLNVENPEGYGRFALMLTNENNFELGILTLGGAKEVPSSCNLLIIGGPTDPFDRTELDAIQRYLEQGGRMLVTFNSKTIQERRPTGLEKLLERWGIHVGEHIVNDREHSAQGAWDILPVQMGQHPIVNPLQNSRVQLLAPRSISALQGARRPGGVTVDELLFTGPNAVPIVDLRTLQPDYSQRGRKPLMAVAEKSVPALQRGSTRIAVIGTSSVFDNSYLNALANHQFGALTANWLVNQSVLLSDIAPQPIRTFQLTMTRAQLRSVQLILLVGMPAAALFVGFLVWARRRH